MFSNIDKTHIPEDEKLLAFLSAIAASVLQLRLAAPLPDERPSTLSALEVDGRWAFWRVFKPFFNVHFICSETQNSILSIQKRKSFLTSFLLSCTNVFHSNPKLNFVDSEEKIFFDEFFALLYKCFPLKPKTQFCRFRRENLFDECFALLYKCFPLKPKTQFCRSRIQKNQNRHLGATQTQIWCLIMPPFGHVMDPFMPPSAHYMAKVYIPWPKFCVWASSIFTWINGSGQG